jgi:hypothetical protein
LAGGSPWSICPHLWYRAQRNSVSWSVWSHLEFQPVYLLLHPHLQQIRYSHPILVYNHQPQSCSITINILRDWRGGGNFLTFNKQNHELHCTMQRAFLSWLHPINSKQVYSSESKRPFQIFPLFFACLSWNMQINKRFLLLLF